MLLRRYAALISDSDKKTKYLVSHASYSNPPCLTTLADICRFPVQLCPRQEPYEQYVHASITHPTIRTDRQPHPVPYVVGINPNSPSNPHSAMASGGNDVEAIDTDPVNTTYTLYGALVGGPDRRDRYYDIRSDWPQSEVAIDYNAPLLTLTSMRVIADSKDPYYVNLQDGMYLKVKPDGLPCDAAFPQGCKGPGLSKGARIALGVSLTVVCLVIFGLSGYLIALWIKNNKEGAGIV